MSMTLSRFTAVTRRSIYWRRLLCTDQASGNSQTATTHQNTDDSNNSKETDAEIIKEIVDSSLPFVSQYGWSSQAIAEGAQIAGYSSAAQGLLPRGGGDLVLHFIERCNGELVEYMKDANNNEDGSQKKTTQFIQDAVQHRLRMIIPYIKKWPQAMGLMFMPENAPDALCSSAVMVDDIWYYAGDRSADFNWYTKRAILGKIYYATEVYMIRDKSEDYKKTWQFLDNRFQDIEQLRRISCKVKEGCDNANQLLSGVFTTVANITGINSKGPRVW